MVTLNDVKHQFLALDFGSESGRAELITLRENKIQIEEIHRFPNRPVNLCGTLFWDFPFLFAELLATLRACADKNLSLNGIGISTWGLIMVYWQKMGKFCPIPFIIVMHVPIISMIGRT
jgi:rhamnulokinase